MTRISLFISGALLTALLNCFLLPSASLAASKQPFSPKAAQMSDPACLTDQEAEMVRFVNQYRVHSNFPPVKVSRSLVKVARIHAADLQKHRPDLGHDSKGMRCTTHSWSSHGEWTPGCYTPDHRNADLMRNKPREITNYAYDDVGYEIIYWRSKSPVVPEQAIEGWIKSQDHRALLFETGRWAGIDFKVVGVGIADNYLVLWFGPSIDPLGSLSPCISGQN